MTRWRATAAGAVAAALVLAAASHRPSTGVEIGSAIQAFDPRSSDGAARHTEQVTYDDEDIEIVATYLAVDGTLQGEVPPESQALWAIATRVLPPDELTEIRQLNVVTDGANRTLGMVHRSGMVADRWILSMDSAEAPEVLEETLVHELAHLLTLRRDDLRAGDHECDGVRLDIGCALPGSVLAEWAAEFWPDPMHPARYDHDQFVSEYAASAVHEDLAETFLEYVSDDEPPASQVLAEKFAFFDRHPDLAAVAAEVRTRLATD